MLSIPREMTKPLQHGMLSLTNEQCKLQDHYCTSINKKTHEYMQHVQGPSRYCHQNRFESRGRPWATRSITTLDVKLDHCIKSQLALSSNSDKCNLCGKHDSPTHVRTHPISDDYFGPLRNQHIHTLCHKRFLPCELQISRTLHTLPC